MQFNGEECAISLQVIRGLLTDKNFVIVVEHDLSVLDYLSDFICCLYGKPGAYGVVTMPFSVRDGINIFLAGFVPTENLRFREEALTFKVRLACSNAKHLAVPVHACLKRFCPCVPGQTTVLTARISSTADKGRACRWQRRAAWRWTMVPVASRVTNTPRCRRRWATSRCTCGPTQRPTVLGLLCFTGA